MKPIFLLFFLMITSSYAQLTVRNDNYVFVSDQVLFVNDQVNLGESTSKIYLRDEAQLIQGDGTTGNSGLGELSVYQNGTTHNYAFNFWCSPIGGSSVSLGNSDFSANLLDDATGLITSIDATFTTTLDGTSSPLVIARNWIYTFENSAQYNGWVQRLDTGTIAPGLGFTMKGTSGSGNNQLYDFRGKPNNGTISNSVMDDVWTLVGNPYPSAIDAVAYIHDTDNASAITGTLYYWEQDLSVMSHNVEDYVGGYATYTINAAGTLETFVPATFDTYNTDGSLNTTGSTSTSGKMARRYIPIGQGFMVEGSTGTTGTVYTKNSHRVYYKESDADSEFFRPTNVTDVGMIENEANTENTQIHPYGEIPSDYKRFRLNIDFNNVYTRQLVQTFHDTEATAGFDYGMESKSPSGVSNDAHWVIDDIPFTAQALPFDIDLSIPLRINLSANSTIRIRLFDVQHFETDQAIYVLDTYTGIYTNLQQFPFQITLSQGIYPDRFKVVFKEEATLGTEDLTATSFQVVQNIVAKQLIIQNPDLIKMERIQLYDLLGKLIWSSDEVTPQKEYVIHTNSLSDNVYILKIQPQGQSVFAKKIIVKN